jgi:hypothetical protein
MRLLRTNQDILDFAAARAPTTACARSIREGRAEVSALQRNAPEFQDEYPEVTGWLVKVLNKSHGRCWKIAVLCDEATRSYKVRYLS